MILLVLFAFIAGIVTILSPCILPVLPIVLSGSVGGGKQRPAGIVAGFIASFTFFTLTLSAIVRATGIPSDLLRWISIVVIAIFGLSLLIPAFGKMTEAVFGKLASKVSGTGNRGGFTGGVMMGLSLGLLWTPCVGPILASVITLAASNSVSMASVFITLAYSAGTALPMFLILVTGRNLLNRVPSLTANTGKIQKIFGVVMVLTALAILLNLDRSFQTYILTTFPSYGSGLTAIEDNPLVKKQLDALRGSAKTPGGLLGLNFSPAAPEFIPGGMWFNSPPLTVASLKGKVVLVDFWTYTCINCIRTLPYLKAWYGKYAPKGLVIVGVHTPEFEFEKVSDNVRKAISDFGITYPVMQDNDYATWNAYNNQYWPAEYLIDKDGKIRHTHFGEGDYDESEKAIQDLLAETGVDVSNMPVKNIAYDIQAQTPETYVGYSRMERYASREVVSPDKAAVYTAPETLGQDYFALEGQWTVSGERAAPATGASLSFRFAAAKMFLVMRSGNGKPGKVNVFLDGKPVQADTAGEDVKDGSVTVVDDRLYNLITLKNPGVHTLKLEFVDGNLELYAFTFG